MSDPRVARVGAGELLAHDDHAELAGDRFGLVVHTAGDERYRWTMAQVAAACSILSFMTAAVPITGGAGFIGSSSCAWQRSTS